MPAEAATPAPTEEEPIPLKVGVLNFSSYAPLHIALAEGFYAEEGLAVELVSFAPTDEMIPALASGEIDLISTTLIASIFNAINSGTNIKYVAGKGYLDPDNCPTDAWVASKQALADGLSDPASLKGRNVAVYAGGTPAYMLDVLLERGGLIVEDLNTSYIVESAARMEALRSGAVDLVSLGEPWITIAETSGAGEVWMPYSELVPNLPMGLIIYGPNVMNEKHDAGVRFMAAYLRGLEQYALGKTDRNVEIIAGFTKLTPEQVKGACWTSMKTDGSVNTEAMLAFQEWAVRQGLIDKALELDQFWTDEFLVEATKRLGR
jgi:NitT/TauT family transport system substrate-binding protein